MDKKIIEQVLGQAREEEANLVIWDRRDTFTVEPDDLSEVELADGYLLAKMQEGKATVFVEFDSIYKLVVEKERKSRSGSRAGFGAAS
ncbi:MAG: hypothetical protein WA990_09000 [Rubrobacteraceae bacterium]